MRRSRVKLSALRRVPRGNRHQEDRSILAGPAGGVPPPRDQFPDWRIPKHRDEGPSAKSFRLMRFDDLSPSILQAFLVVAVRRLEVMKPTAAWQFVQNVMQFRLAYGDVRFIEGQIQGPAAVEAWVTRFFSELQDEPIYQDKRHRPTVPIPLRPSSSINTIAHSPLYSSLRRRSPLSPARQANRRWPPDSVSCSATSAQRARRFPSANDWCWKRLDRRPTSLLRNWSSWHSKSTSDLFSSGGTRSVRPQGFGGLIAR
jgi:hypothetical protein